MASLQYSSLRIQNLLLRTTFQSQVINHQALSLTATIRYSGVGRTSRPVIHPTTTTTSTVRSVTTQAFSKNNLNLNLRYPQLNFSNSNNKSSKSNKSNQSNQINPTRSFTTSPSTEMAGVHNLANTSDWKTALTTDADKVLVLDCFATWCGPCKVIAPKVLEFSKKYPEVRFFKLDVDEVPDVAQELGIRAMPTFMLFKNGEKVGEVVGANANALEAAIKNATDA
ncbi:MAG: Cytoplasmic thioredoxin isoenzyme 2 [Cirrosporium novae-zelandiae]|nr:MAG: Cytoplasmic thioredoxin isoenzyme 2 [Cirrosporium novae-zelandiae]